LSYGKWLVLMQICPSCPLVTYLKDFLCHSLLLVALFIDAFTFFPWVLFGSSALVWVLGF
jgi:hypothetical protein